MVQTPRRKKTGEVIARPLSKTTRRLIVAGLASGIPISVFVLAVGGRAWGYWAAILMTVSTGAAALACARLFPGASATPRHRWFQRRIVIVSAAYAAVMLAATAVATLGWVSGIAGRAVAISPVVALLAAIWLTRAPAARPGTAP